MPFELASEEPHGVHLNGIQRLYKFDNGYGASVIKTQFSYGGPEGLWELAVLDPDGELCYTTPVTSDVEGWLSDDDLQEKLAEIDALPVDLNYVYHELVREESNGT